MIDFDIPAMSCGHCVQTITRTVLRIDPAAKVEADLGSHRVRIQSGADTQAIRAALTEEGYPPAA